MDTSVLDSNVKIHLFISFSGNSIRLFYVHRAALALLSNLVLFLLILCDRIVNYIK